MSRRKFIVKPIGFIVVILGAATAAGQLLAPGGQALREAVRSDPSSPAARHALAEEWAQRGDWAAAIREQEVALNLRPDVPDWQYFLGSLYLRRARGGGPAAAGYYSDLDRAAILLQRAADAEPRLPNVHNLLGWLRQEVGDFPAAIEAFRKATQSEPKSASALHNLGLALELDRKPREAAAAYQQAITVDPSFVPAYLSMDSAWQQLGGREAILRDRQDAVRRTPASAVARAQLGHAYWLNDRFPEAAAELRRAVAGSPALAIAHYYLGQTLRQMNDVAGAVREFETALRVKPDVADFVAQLGAAQLSLGQTEAAISNLRKAVRLDGAQATLHYQLGMALRRTGQEEEGARELAQAAELKRGKSAFEQAGLHVVQGIAQLREGKPREASEELRKAVEAKPDYGIGHYYLGIALAQSKEFGEAVPAFERALSMRPQSAEIHYNFGIALWQMGERERAVREFQKTVDLDAGHALARCALGKATGVNSACK